MPDLVLHMYGKAHEVIRNVTKQDFCYRVHDTEVEARPIFTQEVIDRYIETEAGLVQEGWIWDGNGFYPPPPPPEAWPPGAGGGPKPETEPLRLNLLIDKTTIIERLHEAGKLEEYRTKLDAAPILFREKWNAVPRINPYDQANLDFIASLGANPLVVLDPRQPKLTPKTDVL